MMATTSMEMGATATARLRRAGNALKVAKPEETNACQLSPLDHLESARNLLASLTRHADLRILVSSLQ